MDDILELLLDILFDGTLHAVESKKVPLLIRVLLGLVLAAIVLGISGLLIAAGVNSGNIAITILGIAFLCAALIYAYWKWRKRVRK